METRRKKIYDIIEPHSRETKLSKGYDIFMIITILLSLVPLLFTKQNLVLNVIDKVTVSIFIIDYILRIMTADFKYQKKVLRSFLRYPFSPMAIIDLITILPSITPLDNSLKALRVLRLFRALKVIRILRYSRSIQTLIRVFQKQRTLLLTVLGFTIGYVFVTALMIFQIEPETFKNIFDALYWATISLTTVGYGDIYAVSQLGRLITMISSLAGVAVVALPAGIITAGYIQEMNDKDSD